MSDLISRKAVMDAMKFICPKGCEEGFWYIPMQAVMDLPSVNSERKMGRWIDVFGGCKCSECDCLEAGYSDYCPNCGCSMSETDPSDG